MNEYVVYKGDDIVAIGTIPELSRRLRIKEDGLRCLATPSRHKRRKGGKNLLAYKVGKEYAE